MDERVWGLAILASRDMDPVLGGSRAHNDGHMDMLSDQSMTSIIANEKPTRLAPPRQTRCRVARKIKSGTPDGVGPHTTILAVIIN